jgi:hypothetical protein
MIKDKVSAAMRMPLARVRAMRVAGCLRALAAAPGLLLLAHARARAQ